MTMSESSKIPFDLGTVISRGRLGNVHLARRTDNVQPEEIVVKLLSLPADTTAAEHLKNECDKKLAPILALQHEHLVKHLQLQVSALRTDDTSNIECPTEHYCVLMEYCSGGTLHHAAKDMTNVRYAQKWTRQICQGLIYLHQNRIIHRDIKGANILLSSPDYTTCSIKIADLGDCKQIGSALTKPNEVSHSKGTTDFMSPEMMGGDVDNVDFNVGRKTDIWSFGCVVLQMYTGEHPRFFKPNPRHPHSVMEVTDMAAVFYVGNGGSPNIPTVVPKNVEGFIRQCLIRNPAERPSAADLLQDPFLLLE